MLTIPGEARLMTDDKLEEVEHKHELFRHKYEREGLLVAGAGLDYINESTSVDTNGVHEPTNEVSNIPEVTAFYVLRCDLETAKSIANELIDEHVVSINIRKVHHSNGLK